MPYLNPPGAVADFDLKEGGRYLNPPGAVADFDLADYGLPEIIYPPVPGVVASYGTRWNRPGIKELRLASLFGAPTPREITPRIAANSASARPDPTINARHNDAPRRDQSRASPWGAAQARERGLTAPSNQAPPKDLDSHAIGWQDAGRQLAADMRSSFLVATPWKDRQAVEQWRSSAVHAPTWTREGNIPGPLAIPLQGLANITLDRRLRPYSPGHIVLGYQWQANPVQPKDSTFIAPHSDADNKDIKHTMPWGPGGARDTTLDFEYPDYSGPVTDPDQPETFFIPTLRIYIVTNSASIVRVSDSRDVPASAVSMSISADTYSWDMSATLSGRDALALVEGTDGEPVEVDVTINGEAWRVLIDGWRLSEAWRSNGGTVRGRSRAAYLAAPYAQPRDYVEGSSQLAQQLADQELPPGWTLQWDIDDWTVPAGAWKYQGLSPIDAISRIAAAGGGYVQADRSLDKVIVRPLYAAAPWALGAETPDFAIPRDIIVQRSSDKRPGQGVNAVFVHGGDPGGILAKVVRTGSAGDVLTTTVVDSLITATEPARARGIAAIARTSRQSSESHELPLSEAYGGLIETGSLVAIGGEVDGEFSGDWRGIVRGVSVRAAATRARNGGVALSVRQSIEIERHFEE